MRSFIGLKEMWSKQVMKRLGIYVFYEANGVVDDGVEYLLEAMKHLFHKMIFVVNGAINEEGIEKIQAYTSCIMQRENYGYDAGAYKDVFSRWVTSEERCSYDEIVLMNNSFYGPLFNIDDTWAQMDAVKADFWGMTRHLEGIWEKKTQFPQHIQAYFLVIRKRMLESDWFTAFWENIKYPDIFERAVFDFEIQFTTYFEEHGFEGRAVTDVTEWGVTLAQNENPYMLYSNELIRNAKMPFLKKKCLYIENPGYINTIEALEYIEKTKLYDVERIWKNIFRECLAGTYGSILNYYRLEQFYAQHDRIYIYGAGQYGKALERYFQYRKWKQEAFVVTSKVSESTEKVISYSELKLSSKDGIILALGRANTKEVYNNIKVGVPKEQIFIFDNL